MGVETYVVTGAQYGSGVHNKALDALEKYFLPRFNAELLILPTKYRKTDEEILAPRLQNHKVIDSDFSFLKNLHLKKSYVRPQSIEPTTGFARFAKKHGTTIYASPKQRLKALPNDRDLPKILLTTGFITKPKYDEGFVISEKAKEDHKYGAVVLEIIDNKYYHFRNIEFTYRGGFSDLGVKYHAHKSPTEDRPAIVFGDIHAAVLDPSVHKANLEMIKQYNPKLITLHDLFDGRTVNHWSEKKLLDKQSEYSDTNLDLMGEAKLTYDILKQYSDAMPSDGKVNVVKSNHDERIDRWVNEARYIREPQNEILGHKIRLAIHEGKDSLEYLLSQVGDIPKNVNFLSRNSNYNYAGVEIGYHGDERFNGGRGSMRSLEHAYGNSVTAHKHTPEILRDTYVVGTSTYLQQDYNSGNSAWMHTHALIYGNGKKQLVNIVNGEWTSNKKIN